FSDASYLYYRSYKLITSKPVTLDKTSLYYIDTLESTALKFPDKYTTYSTNENRLLIEKMKFEMNVHGMKLKSVGISSKGTKSHCFWHVYICI
ncbi:hypothetical protein KSF78_0009748, partial [Schistosoma japonicum]